MARQGNTTEIGLGYSHQQDRARAIRAMPDGTLCELCGRPMFKRTQKLQYDHVIPRALGGKDGPRRVVHAICNLRAGQRLRTQLYRNRPRTAYTRW